jgi:hypothetical protein
MPATKRGVSGRPCGGTATLKVTDGSRAVPGKVPRGSFHPKADSSFSSLGRLLLDRLAFRDPTFDARFVQLALQRRRDPASATKSIAAGLKRTGAQPCLVVVSPVPPHTDERDVVLAVFIFSPEARRDISVEVLKELYGLTVAQAEVARQLFAGRSVEQAELMHLLSQGPNAL